MDNMHLLCFQAGSFNVCIIIIKNHRLCIFLSLYSHEKVNTEFFFRLTREGLGPVIDE